MQITECAIIIVAYNRSKSLQRLLLSISNANFNTNNVNLIISIDKSEGNEGVIAVANNFDWKNGKKQIIEHRENLGLRKHIIKCMHHVFEFENIIILEDDLFVSPSFYNYALQSLEFVKNKEFVAGISLYNHQFNVHTDTNFNAIIDGYDNWYFQFASSWGQIFNKTHIKEFLDWYENEPNLSSNETIPMGVRSWSEKSWLKYFIAFTIEKNKYFLYPQISLSTNFSDEGTHMESDTTRYQVPLAGSSNHKYNFSLLSESKSVYDAFFENKRLYIPLNIPSRNLTIDLYGYKTNYKTEYILSSQILNFKVIKSFKRSLKPHDANITYNLMGKDLFLYDCTNTELNQFKRNKLGELMYQIKNISFSDLTYLWFNLFTAKIKSKFLK